MSKATVGLEFRSKLIKTNDNQIINTQIWDTAGQEKYRSLTKNYYRKALGAILVFDISDNKSFVNL